MISPHNSQSVYAMQLLDYPHMTLAEEDYSSIDSHQEYCKSLMNVAISRERYMIINKTHLQ